MVRELIIVGAGGLGREVLWQIQEINSQKKTWNIMGFIDDAEKLQNTMVNEYPVLGNVNWLSEYAEKVSVVCCIANPRLRESIILKLRQNSNIVYPNIIAPDIRLSPRVHMGIGNVICLSTVLTVDINIGDFNIINPACTIGHDVIIDNYTTIYPGSNIAGAVYLGKQVEVGTGTQIIQGLRITGNVLIGAGSVVIRDITEAGTYVGGPVKKIK